MLVFVYVLSRQVREATLNPIEQILVMVLVEVCVGFGSTRDVHCVVISYQQSRISSLSFEKSVQDVLRELEDKPGCIHLDGGRASRNKRCGFGSVETWQTANRRG